MAGQLSFFGLPSAASPPEGPRDPSAQASRAEPVGQSPSSWRPPCGDQDKHPAGDAVSFHLALQVLGDRLEECFGRRLDRIDGCLMRVEDLLAASATTFRASSGSIAPTPSKTKKPAPLPLVDVTTEAPLPAEFRFTPRVNQTEGDRRPGVSEAGDSRCLSASSGVSKPRSLPGKQRNHLDPTADLEAIGIDVHPQLGISTELQESQVLRVFSSNGANVPLTPRPVWETIGSECEHELSIDGAPLQESVTADFVAGSDTDSLMDNAQNGPGLTIHPSSKARLIWDIMSMAFILYDLVVMPLVMAFDLEDTPFLLAMFSLGLTWWTADIVLSFFTGYYVAGTAEMRPLRIVIHYLQTWFFVDMMIILADWAVFILGHDRPGVALIRVGKSLRVLRITRSLRLLRLFKVRRMWEEIEDRITSEWFHIILGVMKLTLIIVCINHIIACAWWAIGMSTSKIETSAWVREGSYTVEAAVYQYLTSLHWSLTQFTPASMEVVPRNVFERGFAVSILLFALLVFSSFVSSITAAMTQLRQLNTTYDKSFSTLRRYLRERGVAQDLTVRVIRYAEHRIQMQTARVEEADVQLLQVLSRPLQMELRRQVVSPTLVKHPLFRSISECDNEAMQRLCTTAVSKIALSKEDALFTDASTNDRMYFLLTGRLMYLPSALGTCRTSSTRKAASPIGAPKDGAAERPVAERPPEHTVHEGEWCCEAALWTRCVHRGTMRASTMSEVFSVTVQEFVNATVPLERIAFCLRRYALKYVEFLNDHTAQPRPVNMTDLSGCPDTELEGMVHDAFSPSFGRLNGMVGPASRYSKQWTGSLDSNPARDVIKKLANSATRLLS